MTRKHVAVLMGGMSSEHDVSIASGTMVAESLDRERYNVTPVTVTRQGEWLFGDDAPVSIYEAVPRLRDRRVDCALLALHGPFGEDGRIQGMLDLLGIPYTSSGCAASALAMDKARAKSVANDAGIRVARHIVFDLGMWEADRTAVLERVQSEIGLPCVVKVPCQGSSLGMAIPQTADAFPEAVEDVFRYGSEIMAKQFVAGTEVTCAVLALTPGEEPRALPVTEIRPTSSAYFDYEAKYTPGAAREITPADISEDLTLAVQESAVRAHQALGCEIWSRSDYIIDADGPVWLEVNTIPGMTPTSLYPQAAAAIGISFSELMGLFVEAAMARHARTREECRQ